MENLDGRPTDIHDLNWKAKKMLGRYGMDASPDFRPPYVIAANILGTANPECKWAGPVNIADGPLIKLCIAAVRQQAGDGNVL